MADYGMKTNQKTIRALTAAALGLVALAVYLPSLQNGFVNYDDHNYILYNPMIRRFDLSFIKWAFTTNHVSNWHPLTWVSYGMEYALWKENAAGFHLVNIIIHAVNTALVFVLTARLAGTGLCGRVGADRAAYTAGLAAALLFGIHPVHVESVSWVSELKDMLSMSFFLLSVLCYASYARPSGRRAFFYASAIFFFMLALMSKPMAITLPAVLLIIDFYPLRRGGLKRIFIEKIPFFALSMASAALTLWAHQRSGTFMKLDDYPFALRVASAIKAYAFYIHKLFFPAHLAPLYPLPPASEYFDSGFVLSIAFLSGVAALSIFLLRKSRLLAAVFLFYLVTLVPVIGIVQVGTQAAADRYLYIPALGIFMLAGAAFAWIVQKARGGAVKYFFYSGLVLAAIALSALTVRQQAVWKDTITLWTHEIKEFPGYHMAHIYRGLENERLGNLDKAVEDYSNALAINPAYVYANLDRGIVYGKMNRLDLALEDFNRAVNGKPDYAKAYYYRAIALHNIGRVREAADDLTSVIRIEPGFLDAYLKRGAVYLSVKDYENALRDFGSALKLQPDNAYAYYNIGLIYSGTGDTEKAVRALKKANALGMKEAYLTLKGMGVE